ncbi:hypothetical protein JS756_22195 [Streptomyces actuosus]|uniref:Uncharacterized protein n=1 Tax=Streptomyces actuosus TaxID=1885 RepID=A0ABS2VUJ4_STRAS|nr:hypothetical protein [Streptomyces actuosus]
MLTHNRDLHGVDLGWRPKGEELPWRPSLQQAERSENGAPNVRHRHGVKVEAVRTVRELVSARAPRPRIRYAF